MKTLTVNKSNSEQMITLRNRDLSMIAIQIAGRPDRGDELWHADASHFAVTFTRLGKKPAITVLYSQGSAIKTRPGMDDVFYSMLSDGAPMFDGETFEQWAENLGYSTDSRDAERIYNACLENGKKIKTLFSNSEISELREIFSDY